jgi:hypothetical protein
MVKRQETLKENNITFRRIYFSEGFIDTYFGRIDPQTEKPISENNIFYRLHGTSEWLEKKNFLQIEKEMNNVQSRAEEVWIKSLVCTKKI